MQSHQTAQSVTESQRTLTLFKPNDSLPLQQPQLTKSSIYILGTGGTIAGTADSSTSANYAASKLAITSILDSIPELKKIDEEIRAFDVFQICSEDITTKHWLELAKKVNQLLAMPSVTGVVITHGTDTLEETAYFLDLVVHSDKPVVLVGAMRAATSMSADGPLNLFNALSVVHAPTAKGQGVMVVMNDTIYDARTVTKCNTTQVHTFQAPNAGPLGHVHYGNVHFERKVLRQHTVDTPFDVMQLEELPTVEIMYEHAGSSGAVLKAIIGQKPDGIVIAGVGDGIYMLQIVLS